MDNDPQFLKLDTDSLKVETNLILEQISALISHHASQLDSRHRTNQKQLKSQIKRVDDLELRMAIIAQMNAGKSTTINAIIGQDILPTHDMAMTTLPTELVQNSDLDEPLLILNKGLVDEFKEAISRLKEKLNDPDFLEEHSCELGDLASGSADDGYIKSELEKIRKGISIQSQIEGRDQIIDVLRFLNHIIRIFNKFLPEEISLLERLSIAPRIETSFWRSTQTERLKDQGRLIFVDTPGPNEAGASILKSIVKKELKESSLILAVLDYQQLNGEATAQIKQAVEEVIRIRGVDNLYVLVNKVDQRGRNHVVSEQVYQFVKNELNIDNREKIFEVSARDAFYATNFLRDIQSSPNRPLSELESARILAPRFLGEFDWEINLPNTDTEGFKYQANRLWEKSGFPPFMDKVVNALTKQGAHFCMRTALEMGNHCLSELREDLDEILKLH